MKSIHPWPNILRRAETGRQFRLTHNTWVLSSHFQEGIHQYLHQAYCAYKSPPNMIVSKLPATLLLRTLLIGTKACLIATGQFSAGLTTIFRFDTIDDGVHTCGFGCEGHINDCNGDCIAGYSALLRTGADYTGDPPILDYHTPPGSYSVSLPISGVDCTNCCGGVIPCRCCTVRMGGRFFGC